MMDAICSILSREGRKQAEKGFCVRLGASLTQ